ncbi:MAG: pyridoxamine 5'-phosphate oxidase [Candidatus Poribacteria bacterium]|nr:pyridoxamine 5'-phosphate oxidase [Candidatus Poribacteria bacterium]
METDELRREYDSDGLRESNAAENPFEQFELWFQQAVDAKIDLPDAMTLATASKDGLPSARIVLLRGFDERGLVFFTDYQSQKGQELAGNPHAALVFYWRELDRQIRVSGTVSTVSREESEKYFRSRPVGSQLAALVSNQSEVIPNRQKLECRYKQLMETYRHKEVPLPSYWGGFRLLPDWFEFWQGRPNRLHDRLRYTHHTGGGWKIERLSP